MSEYWKSTPSYWCKFCSQYVRDTSIERKNHEATARHQNNIQRSLRELHKSHEREKREKQQAKDEVARLNGMFGGKPSENKSKSPAAPTSSSLSRPPPPAVNTAAQRRAHAEQLAALGVELPEELKKEVTGVGSYHVVSEETVQPAQTGNVTVNRSLAEILAEAKRQGSEGSPNQVETEEGATAGANKRKAEYGEDIRDEEAAPKRRAWGSSLKSYPGAKDENDVPGDLDALLGGIKKKEPSVKPEVNEPDVKTEDDAELLKPLDAVPDVNVPAATTVKQEGQNAVPAVLFKKRKGKR